MPLAVELAEAFAPEHLEISDARRRGDRRRASRASGAVFVGRQRRDRLRRLRRRLQPRPAHRGRGALRLGPRPDHVPAEDVRGRHDRRGRRGAHARTWPRWPTPRASPCTAARPRPGGRRREPRGRGAPDDGRDRRARARRPRRHRGGRRSRPASGFFDHMLTLLARHSLIDLEVEARGDLETGSHHTVEDVGITLGQALDDGAGRPGGHRALRLGPGPDGRVPRAGRDRPLRAPVRGLRRAAAGRR